MMLMIFSHFFNSVGKKDIGLLMISCISTQDQVRLRTILRGLTVLGFMKYKINIRQE